MDSTIAFDINDSLKAYLSDPNAIPTPEADSTLQDCENDPDGFTLSIVDNVLDQIVDAVAENPEAVCRSYVIDSLQFLLKCAPTAPLARSIYTHDPDCEFFAFGRSSSLLPASALSRILDIVVSGLATETDAAHSDTNADETEAVQAHKQLLEAYGFLLQWTISAIETKAAEKSASASASAIRSKGGKANKSKSKDSWDASAQIQTALETMCKVLKLRLPKIFTTTSDRDTLIGLFTRAVYLILESEVRVKNTAIRMHSFKVICIAVKHHGHAYGKSLGLVYEVNDDSVEEGAQTSIVQNLTYFEHLSEPMAELLNILAEQYDFAQLSEDVLRELSSKEFNSNDLKGPRSVSAFISKLSELAPRLVIKQMTSLAQFLDADSYTLRSSVIDVCGNLIAMLSKLEVSEQADNHKAQLNAFFDVLEERFLDINPYCRCRALQVFAKICDLEAKFPKRRQTAAQLACRSLEDKSSNVRRNAVKVLGKLVSSHPFNMLHGGQLSLKDWNGRYEAVEAELSALKPPTGSPGLAESTSQDQANEGLLDEATELGPEGSETEPKPLTDEQKAEALTKAAEEAATSEAVGRLQLTRRYYVEALRFIEVLHSASPIICQLLLSKNRSEVIEAMDFFMIADAYKIETARNGIRKMLHLIWTKGNSDEGKGVQTHLIECYKGIFFDAPGTFNANDAANYVARNMISLTFGASLAELTSLEQLLATMMKSEFVSDLVIAKLWQVYGVQRKDISKTQRRGAIVVLGMLASANPNIVVQEVESMLTIGLGEYGKADLALAKHTCVALTRIKPSGRKAKDSPTFARLSNDHIILLKLAAMAELSSESKDWYGLAEQAVGAIYSLSKHPDVLCAEILRRRTRVVFAKTKSSSDESLGPIEEGEQSVTRPEPTSSKQSSTRSLTQLLFLVGHIAIKQIVHLELCELDFKKRKADKEKEKTTTRLAPEQGPAEDNELDLIGGTSEDDFTEAMAHIREREILFSSNALLANFGPLAIEICSNNTTYQDRNLQAVATICMAKLMCVSSEYCEKNLPLLITILERSQDPVTRSNVVIALGDMAVCFNNLIDENTDFLYRRLSDRDDSVKRTCLMTLTFLILAGQVKVKGQLGEMAKCLEDSDKRVADLSRMFFTELATKENAVYNQYVDMFSVLSADQTLGEESFKKILKFLSSFIEKDKHAKQLAHKFAARLTRCENERQWNDVAYALSLLQHKDEEITKTIGEGFRVVQAEA
ncbi:MAG: Condensin complex subunit [Chrysothrix sp. TS-e1954]|nr:MAG: Condensin complex subunit [Chrysothrix sp. TS-e1954]